MQPTARRIALVAVQAALATAGIFVVMLLFSRPAHAATAALTPLKATLTSTLSGTTSTLGSASSPVTSTVNSAIVAGYASSASLRGPRLARELDRRQRRTAPRHPGHGARPGHQRAQPALLGSGTHERPGRLARRQRARPGRPRRSGGSGRVERSQDAGARAPSRPLRVHPATRADGSRHPPGDPGRRRRRQGPAARLCGPGRHPAPVTGPAATIAAKTTTSAPVTGAAAPVVTPTAKTLAPVPARSAPVVTYHGANDDGHQCTATPCGPGRSTTVAKTLAPVTGAVTPVVTTVAKTLGPGHRRSRPDRHHRGEDPGTGHRRSDPGRGHVARTLAPVTDVVAPLVSPGG